jgi:hypothetical protein
LMFIEAFFHALKNRSRCHKLYLMVLACKLDRFRLTIKMSTSIKWSNLLKNVSIIYKGSLVNILE